VEVPLLFEDGVHPLLAVGGDGRDDPLQQCPEKPLLR
jgi:hypothetical protein